MIRGLTGTTRENLSFFNVFEMPRPRLRVLISCEFDQLFLDCYLNLTCLQTWDFTFYTVMFLQLSICTCSGVYALCICMCVYIIN